MILPYVCPDCLAAHQAISSDSLAHNLGALFLAAISENLIRNQLALNQAIFGNIRFERPRLFTDGPDAPCEMIVTKL